MEVISLLSSLRLTHKDVEGLNYFERCNVLNSIAVLLGRHFQHKVEMFLKKNIADSIWVIRKSYILCNKSGVSI